MFHLRPFAWDGNWSALILALAFLAFGLSGLRYTARLASYSEVRRESAPAWLHGFLHLMGSTEDTPAVSRAYVRLAALSALAGSAFLVKVAFFSTC